MSYRLITKATLTIVAASGVALVPRVIDIRAYPSPKRDASGMLTLDGVMVSYKRTGGKGRGTADHCYVYFPVGTESAYGHLAAFVREAPEPQRHALWQALAAAMMQRVGERPVWLSTAGAGVPWLHVRLDDRPKYYGFAPYRQWV